MKTTLLAAAIALSFAAAPAFAGEGNGNPFPYNAGALVSVTTNARVADVGSEAPINPVGRPGTQLATLSNELLPSTGREAVVQTANSAPVGFQVGTVAYAQAQSVNRYFAEQAQRNAARLASASTASARQQRN